MKALKNQNFEKKLPRGYKLALHINAKSAKLGIMFNLIALVVWVLVMAVAVLSLHLGGKLSPDILRMKYSRYVITCFVFIVSTMLYLVLHELMHGIAYKALTGEKLTFGISWSCAFCGVPQIYTYRRTAMIAVIAPFAVFTVVLIPALVLLYCFNPLYYLLMSVIFGLHLGGCYGDLYVFYFLAVRFKNKKTLMHDTGPEQFFYVPREKNVFFR